MISPVIFGPDHAFKWQNTLFLTKKLFIKVSMMRRSRLVLFLQVKFLCFGTRREVFIVRRCSLKKWYLRFYLTQIVHSNHKMLFSRPKDCFWCAALVKLFFLQGKVCVLYPCVGKSLARCLSFEAFRRPCRRNLHLYILISCSFKRENTLLLTKGLFIKVSMARCSH